jgi:hypothetical protein
LSELFSAEIGNHEIDPWPDLRINCWSFKLSMITKQSRDQSVEKIFGVVKRIKKVNRTTIAASRQALLLPETELSFLLFSFFFCIRNKKKFEGPVEKSRKLKRRKVGAF